jgi:hypothetical protein
VQRYANYENFDPSQPFAPYASQAFDAPPPSPLEQPRPSMVDQITVDIFGDPNLGMASSSHTTMPSFFDSSLYTDQDLIELHLMTTCLRTKMIIRSQDIKLLQTPIFFFLDDC